MAVQRTRAALRRRTPRTVRVAIWRVWMLLRRQRPGLLMRYARPAAPTEIEAPAGYEIRAWRPGDDEGWVDLLNASGAFGSWTPARLAAETRGLLREAQFFAVQEGKLVAATGILARSLRRKPALELAWVARHPAHGGKELGRAVVIRALRAALALPGRRPVHLYTDDHRLTAIAIYLDLGFVPDLRSHRSYPGRWEAVFRALARRGQRATGSGEAAADRGEDGPASAPGY